MPDIKQAKILIMATDGFEQSELLVPQEKLEDAGAKVEVASPKSRRKSGKIYGWNKDDWGKTVSVDKDLEDVNVAEYDALVLPGGQIKSRQAAPRAEGARDHPQLRRFGQGRGRDLSCTVPTDRGRSG